MSKILRAIRRKYRQIRYGDVIEHRGFKLPVIRPNEGLEDNDTYIDSCYYDFKKMIEKVNYKEDDLVLDYGCGYGRLWQHLDMVEDEFFYMGIDCNLDAVEWCNKYLDDGSFHFVDLYHPRYNPGGTELQVGISNPYSADIVIMQSVVSHANYEELESLFWFANRALKTGGRFAFTAFVGATSIDDDRHRCVFSEEELTLQLDNYFFTDIRSEWCNSRTSQKLFTAVRE